MLKYILLPVLVFSLIIAVIYSIEVLSAPDASTGGGKAAAPAVSFMQGVDVVSIRDGRPDWSLSSPRVEIAGQEVSVFGVEARMEAGDLGVNAPRGMYQMQSGALRLSGGVSMKGEGISLMTSAVAFDASNKTLSGNDAVEIEGEGFRLTGRGFIARGQSVRLLSDVKAYYY